MKILFLNHNLSGRGTYWRCWELARSLVKLGHEVTLVSASGDLRFRSCREVRGGVQVLLPPRWGSPGTHDGGWSPVDVLYRCGWILGKRFDIIHAFAHRPNVSLPWFLKQWIPRGATFLADWDDWWTRGGIITPRRRWKLLDTLEAILLEERVPRKASGLTVVSTCLKDRALKLGIAKDRIQLLPQGANPERIRPESRETCRRKLGLPLHSPVINYVGYAVWDVKVLLEAFTEIRKLFPETLLQIIGYDKDGELPKWVDASPDKEHILQRGQVAGEEISTYLGAGDVQALPMRDRLDNQARWPIKLGDYLVSARPVVMQKVGDGAAMIEQNNLGIVTGQSALEFAQGLLKVLKDREKAEAMGLNARQYAEQKMRWEDRAKTLVEFYQIIRKSSKR